MRTYTRPMGIMVLIIALCAGTLIVYASSKAHGVSLWDGASCSNGSLNLSLTTHGATREYYRTTTDYGAVLAEAEQETFMKDMDGTFNGFYIDFAPQLRDTVIASYVYVGETPPDPATTSEFLLVYKCGPQNEVLYTCYGDYGTCAQTAEEAQGESGEDGDDNRLNRGYGDGHIAILYPAEEESGVDIYIYATREYIPNFITAADLPETRPEEEIVLRQAEGVVARYLPTGEIVFNLGPDEEGKTYAFVMSDIVGTVMYGYRFDPQE